MNGYEWMDDYGGWMIRWWMDDQIVDILLDGGQIGKLDLVVDFILAVIDALLTFLLVCICEKRNRDITTYYLYNKYTTYVVQHTQHQ